jgi:serine/threonine-protein kinase
VGIIAWRTLVGRHPFLPNEPRALIMAHALQPLPSIADERPELSVFPGLVAAVSRACAKELAERHPNATALKTDFATSIGPLFIPPPPPSPTLTPGRPITLPPIPRATFDLQPPTGLDGGMETTTPALEHSPTLEREFHFARLRTSAVQSWGSVRVLVSEPLLRLAGHVAAGLRWLQRHPAVAALLVAIAIGAVAASLQASARHRRLPAEARALLQAGKAAEARELLARELSHDAANAELQLLLGHATHRADSGKIGGCIDAYAAALALGPLDEEALANLASHLGSDGPIADRASHLLARVGEPALTAILAESQEGPGPKRLRALGLARDLGGEEQINRVATYSALLKESDCEVRRAAARRLGELGDPTAIPALKLAAKARRDVKSGFFGRTERVAACGAPEATAAVKRIEALQAASAPAPAPGR